MKNRYPDYLMRLFRERLDLDPQDTSRDTIINTYTPNEAFSEVLEWEGLLGSFQYQLERWIKDIYSIDLSHSAAQQKSVTIPCESLGFLTLPEDQMQKFASLLVQCQFSGDPQKLKDFIYNSGIDGIEYQPLQEKEKEEDLVSMMAQDEEDDMDL